MVGGAAGCHVAGHAQAAVHDTKWKTRQSRTYACNGAGDHCLHNQYVQAISAPSPSAAMMATVLADGNLLVWDFRESHAADKEAATLMVHQAGVVP